MRENRIAAVGLLTAAGVALPGLQPAGASTTPSAGGTVPDSTVEHRRRRRRRRQISELGVPGRGRARARFVNGAGQVVGSCQTTAGPPAPVRWTGADATGPDVAGRGFHGLCSVVSGQERLGNPWQIQPMAPADPGIDPPFEKFCSLGTLVPDPGHSG
ncbi:hypothetical protein AB0425_02585 [Actinosynnema sp. NPDC051121]|nr:hypothetical protein [Saccharothrix sp.]